MFDNMQIKVLGKEDEMVKGSEFNSEDEEEGSEFDINTSYVDNLGDKSQKHQKFIDLEERAKEDMDFPDEVDTPVDQLARERF